MERKLRYLDSGELNKLFGWLHDEIKDNNGHLKEITKPSDSPKPSIIVANAIYTIHEEELDVCVVDGEAAILYSDTHAEGLQDKGIIDFSK